MPQNLCQDDDGVPVSLVKTEAVVDDYLQDLVTVEQHMDILYGSLYYRLLVGHLPLNEDFVLKLPE